MEGPGADYAGQEHIVRQGHIQGGDDLFDHGGSLVALRSAPGPSSGGSCAGCRDAQPEQLRIVNQACIWHTINEYALADEVWQH
jgi:hypothetical protein